MKKRNSKQKNPNLRKSYTKWQFDGHPTGYKVKASLLLLRLRRGLMEVLMPGYVHAWQRNLALSTPLIYWEMQEYTENGENIKVKVSLVFGNSTQSPVAISILVKNPNAEYDNCHIHYKDIGAALKCEEKLAKLSEAMSVLGFRKWESITPNKHYDWIEQRSDDFQLFYPIGSKDAKAGRIDNAISKLFSTGRTYANSIFKVGDLSC